MSFPPKQIIEPKEGSHYKVILSSVIGIGMVFVTIVYLLYPILQNHDLIAWFNSQNLFAFVFGVFFLSIMMTMVNGRYEYIKKDNIINKDDLEQIIDEHVKTPRKCYCCDKEYPLKEMRVLFICKQCQKDQNIQ